MESSSQGDGLTTIAVTVILAMVIVGAVMIPIVNTVTEPVKIPHTILNIGDSMAIIDGDTHDIEIILDGSNYKISTDGTLMQTVAKTSDDAQPNPFNLFYAAVNLASGDNSDDSGEARLSKEKGAIAYVLNPNNLRQTQNGYVFDPTLYNVMLIIPPVYWYSDGTSKLYVASSSDAFEGLTLEDYAHTYTSEGVTGHTDMIGIGVYEAYNLNGVMTSQADRTPTANTSLTSFVGLANAGNTDNDNSTYRVWNYFDWTLYKIMCWIIMGNTDSQYMMGAGPTSMSASSVTGLTTSAIQKSANAQSSVSLLLENTWGSLYEWLGDAANNAGTLIAGNSLIQPTSAANVANVFEEAVSIPTSSGYYDTINISSDAFGTVATVKSSAGTAGQGIGDQFYGSSSSSRALRVGGSWNNGNVAGVSYGDANGYWSSSGTFIGSRLACTFTGAGDAPVLNAQDYAYILTFDNTNGVTVSNVETVVNGQSTAVMPTGTTLNPYWEFGRMTAPDILSPNVTKHLIAIGDETLVTFYSNGYARVYTATGYDEIARVTAESPQTFIVSDTISYKDNTDSDKTATVTLFMGDGDYVLTEPNEGRFIEDTELYLYSDYISTATRGGIQVYIGYAGTGTAAEPIVTALAPSGPTYDSTDTTITVTDDMDEITGFYATFRTTWTNGSGSDYSEIYSQNVILPKTIEYDTEGESLGLTGSILGIVPIFVILGILIGISAYMSPTIRNRS